MAGKSSNNSKQFKIEIGTVTKFLYNFYIKFYITNVWIKVFHLTTSFSPLYNRENEVGTHMI